ncbi:MAG: outer membrane beta-barrel protein [Bacteroidia bacterium]
MKLRIFLIFIASFVFCQSSFSQVKLLSGPEFGINMSGLPHRSIYNNKPYWTRVETDLPVVRPVFGIWGKAVYGKHFYANVGLQYLWVGMKYHSIREGKKILTNEDYTDETREQQIFQKISIPIALGYQFKIKKLKPGIFLGIKKEYYTYGYHQYENVYTVEGNPDERILFYEYKPFDKTQFSTPAKRWNTGYFAGISFGIKEKINLNLSYTLNQRLNYGNSFGWEFNGYSFYNDDIAVTVKYTLESGKD